MPEINKEQLLNDLAKMQTSFNLLARQFSELREKLDTRPVERAAKYAAKKLQKEFERQRTFDKLLLKNYLSMLNNRGKEEADAFLNRVNNKRTFQQVTETNRMIHATLEAKKIKDNKKSGK